jgi:DNA-directed RNA polymerase specialized sigma24 family protein
MPDSPQTTPLSLATGEQDTCTVEYDDEAVANERAVSEASPTGPMSSVDTDAVVALFDHGTATTSPVPIATVANSRRSPKSVHDQTWAIKTTGLTAPVSTSLLIEIHVQVYGQKSILYACRLVGIGEAPDAVNDAYANLMERYPVFAGDIEGFPRFANTFVFHASMNRRRKQSRWSSTHVDSPEQLDEMKSDALDYSIVAELNYYYQKGDITKEEWELLLLERHEPVKDLAKEASVSKSTLYRRIKAAKDKIMRLL